MAITQQEHPLLLAVAIETFFPQPLGQLETFKSLPTLLSNEYRPPFEKAAGTKGLVRDVFRQSGYKPTGRGKPASEYLVKAVSEDKLGSINLAVDILNVVSLHSGFPISVVDAANVSMPLSIDVAGPGTDYIFNASGQTIKLDYLLCLFDQTGPCANGVKDSQRTKTSGETTNTISILWGAQLLADQVTAAKDWYIELLTKHGAEAREIPVVKLKP